jgi:5-hydroxyisourate hydrolase-like protein (transthyretin family)
MNSEEDFDIEVPTAEEELTSLLDKIETDMKSGRVDLACQGLEALRNEKYQLLQSCHDLYHRYRQLNQYC